MHKATVHILALATIAIFAFVPATRAQAPLPELTIQATDGGSVLHIRNTHSAVVSAFLIELVDYPGSSFSLWQDDAAGEGIPAHSERAIPITNMTVGAAPEYVKMRAAIYGDGSTAGIPEKVTQLVERRRFTLKTIREMIAKLSEAKASGQASSAIAADLRAWSAGLPEGTRRNRNSQETINYNAARSLLAEYAGLLEKQSAFELIQAAEKRAKALASSKPTL